MKIELSHDILARKVFERASSEDKMRLKIEQFIRQRFQFFQQQKTLLSSNELNYIEPFLEMVFLTPEERQFVDKSRTFQRRKFMSAIISTAVTVAVIFGLMVYAFWSKRAVEHTAEQLQITADQLEATQDSVKEAALREQRLAEKEKMLLRDRDGYVRAQDSLILLLETQKAEIEQLRAQAVADGKNAQSRFLSSEAKIALSQKETDKAFQLAKTSWQMNNDNRDACKVLYQLDNKPWSANTKVSQAEVQNIISRFDKRKVKELSPSERNALDIPKFEQQQQVIQSPTITLPTNRPLPKRIGRQ